MKRKIDQTVDTVPTTSIEANEENIQNIRPDENVQVESEYDPETAPSEGSSSTGCIKKKKRYSPVWNHFSIETIDGKTESASCNYCEKKYPLSGKSNGSTSNLIRHLKHAHPEVTVSVASEEIEIIEFSQERYRDALVKWIVTCNQPFSEVEQEAFLEMIKILNPAAITISSSTVKRDIIKKFEEKVKVMTAHLKKVPGKISFTIDAWTSKNFLPFMAIRAHWINSEWVYQTVLLDFVYIDGTHDGKTFSVLFLQCLERFEIPLSKVLALTMDNASNNDTFMEFLRKHGIEVGVGLSAIANRVRCMAHILNLAVQDILACLKIPLNNEDDVVIEVTSEDAAIINEDEDAESDEDEDVSSVPTVPKLRKLVKKIRKSPQMRQKMENHCKFYKMEYRVPVIDVATRWNSTFQMLERADYLKTPLRALCLSEKKLNKFLMTDREWNDLNCIKVLLAKFDRSTQLMSMQRHPTIAAYIPTLNWLIQSVQDFISENPGPMGDAAENGLQKLKKYEAETNIKSSLIPYVGTFLNPALKMNYFKEHSDNKTYHKEIQKTISDLFEKNYANQEVSASPSPAAEELTDEFFLHMFKRAKSNKRPKEFQQYLGSPLSNVKVNVLDFWRSQEHELPNLSNMARDYLAVQSSSVSVERDFSGGVDLVTATRCSLRAQTIRACMCLNSWFKKEENQNC